MHKYDTSQFFKHAFRYVLSHKCDKTEKEIVLVYLCGLLAHHALDSKVHPYVYGRSGYSPEEDNAGACFGTHSLIEINIDKKYLKSRKRMVPSAFQQSKTVFITKGQKRILEDFLSACIAKTYYTERSDNKVFQFYLKRQIGLSIYFHRLFLRMLFDRRGWKRKVVQFIETRVIRHVTLSNIILTDQLRDVIDSMNLRHREWRSPWSPAAPSFESFHALYQKAGAYYLRIMELITDCDTIAVREILTMIADKSYHTGLKSLKYVHV